MDRKPLWNRMSSLSRARTLHRPSQAATQGGRSVNAGGACLARWRRVARVAGGGARTLHRPSRPGGNGRTTFGLRTAGAAGRSGDGAASPGGADQLRRLVRRLSMGSACRADAMERNPAAGAVSG